jgi:hypothetical protein
MENNTETTTVEQVEVNLDELLGTPGAENVMLPEEDKKPSIFSNSTVDLEFIDKPENLDDDEEDEEDDDNNDDEKIVKKSDPDKIKEDLEKLISEVDETDEDDENKGGRPKVSKDGLAEVVNKMVEKGDLFLFDDDKKPEDYTMQDFEELIQANIHERERAVKQNTPQEFFKALPHELQYAAKYVADGGQDLKGLFRVLSQAEEVRDLNPENEQGQRQIVREYLQATKFGDDDDIEEEIVGWLDRGELEAKALKFKPKLDKMQEAVVQRKVAEQEQIRNKQQGAAQMYMDNVYNTLSTGELGGIKLDKKTQGLLYSGLVQPQYPSMSGKPTNLLGHLLEKYQYVEPRHDLIAEALWLLADPEGYKTKVKSQGSKQAIEKTVRQLKTAQAKMTTSAPVVEKDETKVRRIPRNSNFFKR